MRHTREPESAITKTATTAVVTQEARSLALHHGTLILAEIPRVIRRVSLFFLVLTITIPAFLAGLLVVLWLFAR